ncbi:N-acetyltransferase [Archangium violaceum]|uniref:N-acetyltransferase n=1 Tax=Archangium violaceum TaxID=83451 RepID=UPI001950732F|nr:N-acetyltransferase [Archangium violaceum]QRN99436.1 N-acetyltransferase [Archangium violaceum]
MASRRPEAEWVAFLEASSPGTRLWVRGAGRSMYPLLRGGDAIQVERCSDVSRMRPGDIALVRVKERGLAAHVVSSVAPLSTRSFLGRLDEGPVHLLGRVVAVRRLGLRLPVGGRLAPLLLIVHRASARAAGSPHLRRSVQVLRRITSSPATREMRRRWLGPIEVRPLGPEDAEALLLYAGHALRGPTAFLGDALRERWSLEDGAVGAFTARGRMVGFAAREGEWLRYLHVTEEARRLGVGTRLLGVLLEGAASRRSVLVLRAAVREEEVACREFMAGAGFLEVPGGHGAERRSPPWSPSGGTWRELVRPLGDEATPPLRRPEG